jgi:hypothetical protein
MLDPAPGWLEVRRTDAIEAESPALANLPPQLVGISDEGGGADAKADAAIGARQPRVGGKGHVVARGPCVGRHPDHRAERVRQIVGQLTSPPRRGESRQEPTGDGAGVEPAALDVTQRVLGDRRWGAVDQHGIRVAEGSVEAPEERKAQSGALPARRRLDPAADFPGVKRPPEDGLLDLVTEVEDRSVDRPALPA